MKTFFLGIIAIIAKVYLSIFRTMEDSEMYGCFVFIALTGMYIIGALSLLEVRISKYLFAAIMLTSLIASWLVSKHQFPSKESIKSYKISFKQAIFFIVFCAGSIVVFWLGLQRGYPVFW